MRNLALELRLTAAVGGPGTLVGVHLTATGAHRLLTQGSSGLPWLLGGLAAGALAVAALFRTRRLWRDARWLHVDSRVSPLVEDPAVMAVARRGGRLLGAMAGLWGLVTAAGWVVAVHCGTPESSRPRRCSSRSLSDSGR